jgi:putative transposase
MWNLQPPPGFQGLSEDKQLEVYVRHLPHWRQEGATYFITFRLGDSLPSAKLDQLAVLRREWEQLHPRPWVREALERLARQQVEYIEKWLDQGMGSCVLKDPPFAAYLTEAMHHFDGERYELGAYVVMPNHTHAILRPLTCIEHPLEKIVGSWKQFSSKRINARTEAKGDLWQEESYDRIVRDEEHLYRCLQYIGHNPLKTRLAVNEFRLWIRPEWVALGWNFEKT